jgi:lipopolysaccharide transport system permease protein
MSIQVSGERERIMAEAGPSEHQDAPLTVIRPSSGWQLLNLRELWHFRDLFYFLIWRDVKVRYKQTVLGAAWAVLQPALMMVVFTIFFGRLAGVSSGDYPYPVFAYAGLLAWTFFATGVSTAGNSVIGSERLITRIYFPRLLIPFAAVAAAVVDFLIAFGLLVVLMLAYGIDPGWQMLLAPVIFAPILLGALGAGTILSALNVSYRDFRYVIPFLVQIWMFATPSVYMDLDAAKVSETAGSWSSLLALNPLTGLVAAFRASCLGGPIAWEQVALSSLAVAALFVVGCFYFRKVEDGFADII